MSTNEPHELTQANWTLPDCLDALMSALYSEVISATPDHAYEPSSWRGTAQRLQIAFNTCGIGWAKLCIRKKYDPATWRELDGYLSATVKACKDFEIAASQYEHGPNAVRIALSKKEDAELKDILDRMNWLETDGSEFPAAVMALWEKAESEALAATVLMMDLKDAPVERPDGRRLKRQRGSRKMTPVSWKVPGLPHMLNKLAAALSVLGEKMEAKMLASTLGREPSRIVSDHRNSEWAPWIRKHIGRDGKGLWWLKSASK